MKKYLLIALIALMLTFPLISLNTGVYAHQDGKKLFIKWGCLGCHYKDSGKNIKPFPSKEDLAQIPFNTFKKVVLNGIKGSSMTGKKVPKEELKAIYTWLVKNYKKKP